MADTSKKKVFILDNNILSLILAEELLTEHGFEVVKMSVPAGFVAKLEHELPDILLMDVRMPKLNLSQVLKDIRNSKRLGEMATIIYSDLEPQENYELARAHGFNGYFSKSLEIVKLPEFINQLFES